MNFIESFASSNPFLQSSPDHMEIFLRISGISDDYFNVPHMETMYKILAIPRRHFFKMVAELKSNNAWPFETASMLRYGITSQDKLDARIKAARKAKAKRCGEVIKEVDIKEFL